MRTSYFMHQRNQTSMLPNTKASVKCAEPGERPRWGSRFVLLRACTGLSSEQPSFQSVKGNLAEQKTCQEKNDRSQQINEVSQAPGGAGQLPSPKGRLTHVIHLWWYAKPKAVAISVHHVLAKQKGVGRFWLSHGCSMRAKNISMINEISLWGIQKEESWIDYSCILSILLLSLSLFM